jgi:co-chaperonin GroES (HSP10)
MDIGHLDGDKSWITDNNVKDPEVLPDIASYYLLVRPVKVEAKAGSVLLPDSFKDDVQYLTNVGRVVKVGPTAWRDNDGSQNPYGKFGNHFAKEGDYVIWGKHRGTKLKYQAVSYVLLADDEIVMKVDDPKYVNPMDNIAGTAHYRS